MEYSKSFPFENAKLGASAKAIPEILLLLMNDLRSIRLFLTFVTFNTKTLPNLMYYTSSVLNVNKYLWLNVKKLISLIY